MPTWSGSGERPLLGLQTDGRATFPVCPHITSYVSRERETLSASSLVPLLTGAPIPPGGPTFVTSPNPKAPLANTAALQVRAST